MACVATQNLRNNRVVIAKAEGPEAISSFYGGDFFVAQNAPRSDRRHVIS